MQVDPLGIISLHLLETESATYATETEGERVVESRYAENWTERLAKYHRQGFLHRLRNVTLHVSLA